MRKRKLKKMSESCYSSWLLEKRTSPEVFRLRLGVNKIGRHSSCHVRLTEPTQVSRYHAAIFVSHDDKNVKVVDLSVNGIYVNDDFHTDCGVDLQVNDVIGIGVSEKEPSAEVEYSKLPIFKLIYKPIRTVSEGMDSLPTNKLTDSKNNDEQPSCSVAVKKEQQRQHVKEGKGENIVDAADEVVIISSDEEDGEIKATMNTKGDHKEASNQNNVALIHLPLESALKREYVESISNELESIFGNIAGDDEIQNQLKEINPLIYNGVVGRPLLMPTNCDKVLVDGQIIDLRNEDKNDDIEKDVPLQIVELGRLLPNEDYMKLKKIPNSPNIFESSKEEESMETTNEIIQNCDKLDENVRNPSLPDDEALKDYIVNDNKDDDEEFMFSQTVINGMKADLDDNDDFQDHDEEQDPPARDNLVRVKQEPGIQVDNSSAILAKPANYVDPNICWDISDDEENDDENLRMWSKRLLSQSFSQVFELSEKLSDEQVDTDREENQFRINIEHEHDDIFNQSDIDEEKLKEEMFFAIDKTLKGSGIKTTTDNQTRSREENMNRMNKVRANEEKDLLDSPVIGRANSKTRRLAILSSEDECEEKLKGDAPGKTTNKKAQLSGRKQIPPVIEAPRLPKHRNKLRGVSAAPSSKNSTKKPKSNYLEVGKTMCNEKPKVDLSRNHLQMWEHVKGREKCDAKQLKEYRKERLKQLAEKQKNHCKENLKRKHSQDNNNEATAGKKVKVKLTKVNRGAFLAQEDTKSKITKEEIQKKCHNSKPPTKSGAKHNLERRRSLNFETFSQQISKPDEFLNKERKKKEGNKNHGKKEKPTSTPARRHSLNEQIEKRKNSKTVPACKETLAARALRTTNKVTFASMERDLIKSMESTRKLAMANKQILKTAPTASTAVVTSSTPFLDAFKEATIQNAASTDIAKKDKPKKKVRFNDVPIYHYIEPTAGAIRKVVDKDFLPRTTHRDRFEMLSSQFRIIDHTDKIITDILTWSNDWLIKRSAAAAAQIVSPMPRQFSTFDHYKRTLLSLMQLEFMSKLQREYEHTAGAKQFRVKLESVTPTDNGLLMLATTYTYQHSYEAAYSRYDVVILDIPELQKETFAYVSRNHKRGGNVSTIIFEIIPVKMLPWKLSNDTKELIVRPVIDNVRVEFGSFNAVYQLESTPLFRKVLYPLELLNGKLPPKRNIVYKACDRFLNERQKQVLLSTYTRIIDETTPNITLIQGPPGTGKSQVIANLALQTLYGEEVRYLDRKILICAQSNAAVDVIAGKLYEISLRMRVETRFRLIRFGNSDKISPYVQPAVLKNVVIRDQMKKLSKWKCNGTNGEDLQKQVFQLEAEIANARISTISGTVEEDKLKEKIRQLELAKSIMKGSMRPDDEQRMFSWYLSNAHIVCATLSSCVRLTNYVNFFDVCIIDEATQCIEPWTLVPLRFLITSLVLVGDTQQLPATVLSQKADDLGLSTSMFTRIQNCLDNAINSTNLINYNYIVSGLNVQYRMHPEICKWPNLYFYKNNLIDGANTRKLQTPIKSFVMLSLDYTQNDHGGDGKISNSMEAEFVAKLLKALDDYIPNKSNSYGVITPYAQHRQTLNTAIKSMGLSNIMVNTIDSYQGLEKDVIIISNARTSGIGFLASPQRLNVAITRPKKCLILCGNFKNLETVPAWRSLLDSARERKLFYEISPDCIYDIQANVIEKIKLKKPLQETNSN
ncbi:putative helicase senataxin isoform 2-T2 [Glossina fuscipes fuscipes]